MLTELTIRDLAIIESLTLEFGRGLTVLTGETGAGKSIILGALNLLLGERASAEDVRAGASEAEVAARFDLQGHRPTRDVLAAEGLADADDRDATVIRRVISPEGRSRCWVNGAPVAVGTLKRVGEHLVDFHGQHQHHSLLDPARHREVLDEFGDCPEVLDAVAEAHAAWTEARAARRRLEGDARELEQRREFLVFQIREIDAAHLREGELAELEAERGRLRHAEALRRAAALGAERLRDGEEATAVGFLAEVRRELESVAEHDLELAAHIPTLSELEMTLLDVAETLRAYRDRVAADPARLDAVEERISVIRRMLKRHGETEAEVLAKAEAWRREVETLENRDAELERLTREEARLAGALAKAALALRAKREAAAAALGQALVRELRDMAMEKVKFEVRLGVAPDPDGVDVPEHGRVRIDPTGMDDVEFLISPNPGEPVRPLAKIASGGELSRLMLGLKAVSARREGVPTLVFDEIDVGISGETAKRVADKMARLAARHQVLCITHLPQIFARATAHLAVSKAVRAKRTVTQVERLEGDARVEALATLLGGHGGSKAARRHAEEMLGTG